MEEEKKVGEKVGKGEKRERREDRERERENSPNKRSADKLLGEIADGADQEPFGNRARTRPVPPVPPKGAIPERIPV